ncbi:hypothetical protein BASA81_008392 [Batrachochytrium salamandrivorans]|nr:hypothetical protein BASA81_008392 [Batrachochytrium salamandrivorans]
MFVLFGVAIGFPWNALISSTTFYEHRLGDMSLSTLESVLTFAYFGMNLLGYAYLHLCGPGAEMVRTHSRYISSYFAINLVSFSIMTFSPLLPGVDIFWLVVVVGAVLGASSALYQHEMFALSAQVEGATQEFVFGFAIAGFLASLCSLLTRSVASAGLTAGLNFGMTVASLLAAAGLFIRHKSKYMGDDNGDVVAVAADNSYLQEDEETGEDAEKEDLPDIRWFLLVLGNVMCGTLMVFPAVVAGIKPTEQSVNAQQFTSILFVLFNAGDLIGRGIAHRTLSWASPKLLAGMSVARLVVLLPTFACNREQSVTDASPLEDGLVYGLVLCIGVTGGMLFSAAASRAPSALPQDPSKAGKLVALAVAVSLVLGAVLGSLVVAML